LGCQHGYEAQLRRHCQLCEATLGLLLAPMPASGDNGAWPTLTCLLLELRWADLAVVAMALMALLAVWVVWVVAVAAWAARVEVAGMAVWAPVASPLMFSLGQLRHLHHQVVVYGQLCWGGLHDWAT